MYDIKISVIIPVYNVEQYLCECLENVLAQSLREIEVICVNDASTDMSYTILLRYAENDNRIKILNLDINRGLSAARNRGMEIAHGKYLIFVDSDDYIKEGALQKLYSLAEKNLTDVILFSAIQLEQYTNREKEFCIRRTQLNQILPGTTVYKNMVNGGDTCHSVCIQFWNKKFLEKNGTGFMEGILHEDILFTISNLSKVQRALCIEEILYVYRRRTGSITGKAPYEKVKAYMPVCRELLTKLLNKEYPEEITDEIYTVFFRNLKLLNRLMMELPSGFQMKTGQKDKELLNFFSCIMPPRCWVREISREAEKLMNRYSHTIVFGAGVIAEEAIDLCRIKGYKIFALAVSDKKKAPDTVLGLPVHALTEFCKFTDDAAVIICTYRNSISGAEEYIKELGFRHWAGIWKNSGSSDEE